MAASRSLKKPKKTKGKSKRNSNSNRKDMKLRFDANPIISKLKEDFKGTVDPKAGIYLAGVMEYFLAELVELTQNAANEKPGKARATVDDLIRAIESDGELKAIVDVSTIKKPSA